MVKVQCRICGDIGYTASPDRVACVCGGRFREIPGTEPREKVEVDQEIIRLFDTSILTN